WLEERGDSRAEGYRALGRQRAWTHNVNESDEGLKLWTWFPRERGSQRSRRLPAGWFAALEGWECLISNGSTMDAAERWRDYRSRRAADDAAAMAFGKLPPRRRAELLDATPPAPKKRKGKGKT